jgi:hypothetical protein
MTKRDTQLADYRAERAFELARDMERARAGCRAFERKMAEFSRRAAFSIFQKMDAQWDALCPDTLPTLGDGTLPPDEE